jgi:hypothetical protein
MHALKEIKQLTKDNNYVKNLVEEKDQKITQLISKH